MAFNSTNRAVAASPLTLSSTVVASRRATDQARVVGILRFDASCKSQNGFDDLAGHRVDFVGLSSIATARSFSAAVLDIDPTESVFRLFSRKEVSW